MFIRSTRRPVVLIGGGEQAAQKARLILKSDAQIVLAAPEINPELGALVPGRMAYRMGHTGPVRGRSDDLCGDGMPKGSMPRSMLW